MSNESKIEKKCLLIGINYTGTKHQLNGCINDSKNLKQFLIENKYFEKKDFILMNDNKKDGLYPTRSNIIKQLNSLISFAKKNKTKTVYLFIAYSGHGSYIKDQDEDEEDGYDEVICPIDNEVNGNISDDALKKNFIYKLPKNVNLTILVDACHSGTAMDLKYNYKLDKMNNYNVCGALPLTKCQVVMISGSQDNQTSGDAYLKDNKTKKYEYQGAMTASFLANYKKNITYIELVTKMRVWLKKNKFEQVPQLSAGRHININKNFILSNYD